MNTEHPALSTNSVSLPQIEQALAHIATQRASLTQAEEALHAEEAAFLTTLLNSVKPVLRHLDRPIIAACYTPTGNEPPITTLMPEHGILLCGSIYRSGGHRTHGFYAGEDLVLARSGTLYLRRGSGYWSDASDQADYWTTIAADPRFDPDAFNAYDDEDLVPTPSTTPITPLDALRHFPLPKILAALVEAINTTLAATRTKQRALSTRRSSLVAAQRALTPPAEDPHTVYMTGLKTRSSK